MVQYLVAEGYTRESTRSFDRCPYEKMEPNRRWVSVERSRRIDIYTGRCGVITALLLEAQTTASFHWITWNKAYALFPYPTIIEQEGYLIHNRSEPDTSELRQMMSGEGIHIADIKWAGQSKAVTRCRRVGDRYTWIIPLDTVDVRPSATPDEVIESSKFQLYVQTRPPMTLPAGEHVGYEIRAHVLMSPILKYCYIFPERCYNCRKSPSGNPDCTEFYCHRSRDLRRHVNNAFAHEVSKIPTTVQLRHQQYFRRHYQQQKLNPALRTRLDWQKMVSPAEWVFYDQQVIEYLAEVDAQQFYSCSGEDLLK